jgi:hypothetical protein
MYANECASANNKFVGEKFKLIVVCLKINLLFYEYFLSKINTLREIAT